MRELAITDIFLENLGELARTCENQLYWQLQARSPQIPSDPLRSSQVLSDPLRSSQILSDPFRSFHILSDHLRSFQILSDPLRSSQILSDPLRSPAQPRPGSTPPAPEPRNLSKSTIQRHLRAFWWSKIKPRKRPHILSDHLRSSHILSDPLRSSQILSDPLISSQILSDPLRSSSGQRAETRGKEVRATL